MKITNKRHFANGCVYAARLYDGYQIEMTDTFLPSYTKDAIKNKQNFSYHVASRKERWMIGVSCMSGCPIRCKFCATGKLKRYRTLSVDEIVKQIDFVINKNKETFTDAVEHKINYTRMGEPFLMVDTIKKTITEIEEKYKNTHHYISTIGLKGSDFSWIKDNITLQISLHSLNEKRRRNLIPTKNLMTIKELGNIRTNSNLKTTLNLTLISKSDFDIEMLTKYFDPEHFFIKLSSINKNTISELNNLGNGIITTKIIRTHT